MQDVTIDDLDREFVVAFRDQVKAKIALDKAKDAFDAVLWIKEMSEYRDYVKADEEYELSLITNYMPQHKLVSIDRQSLAQFFFEYNHRKR